MEIIKIKFLKKRFNSITYSIRIVGSNISLDRFYDDQAQQNIIEELIKISSPDLRKKTIFLWPEAIIPNTYISGLSLYKNIFSNNFNDNHLIALGITNMEVINNEHKYYNSFSVFDHNLNLLNNYNKINLVPFGEFLPFENILNQLGLKTITNNFGSFSKGKKEKL